MSERLLTRLFCVFCLAITIFLGTGLGQTTKTKKSPTGVMRSSGATISVVAPSQVALGETFTVELQISLGNSKYEDGAPAVLGGYIIPLGFDPSIAEYLAPEAGESPPFNGKPTATNADKANENGVVIAISFTASSAQPMPLLSVAKLTFRAKKAGAAVFTIDPEGAAQHASLASQLHNKTAITIPATYINGVVTIGNVKKPSRPVVKGRGKAGQQ